MGDAYDPSRIAIWVVLRAAAGVAIGSVTYDAGKVPGSCFFYTVFIFYYLNKIFIIIIIFTPGSKDPRG